MKKIHFVFIIIFLGFANVCQAWQQRVVYNIEARLDTVEHKIFAIQYLRYFNNSPDTLKTVWFNLYPNAYRDNSTFFAREAEQQQDYRFRHSCPKDKGWIEINSLLVSDSSAVFKYGPEYGVPFIQGGRADEMATFSDYGGNHPAINKILKEPKYKLDSTSASLQLPIPLAPGDSIDFYFDFTVKVPKFFSRLGHDGNHYEISQWYPKMAVYDEQGWHADGYHYIGEFYGDYGSFQVGLETPKNFKIGATGSEVLEYDDQGQPIDDIAGYHLFAADNVHDFAWCADLEYISTTEQHGETTIKILTRPKDREKWKNVMQYAKDALDYYGRWYGEYPYSTLTVCDGDIEAGGGMEYPNLVIISPGEDKYSRMLEMVVMHEIGHQWFYGILGNNEMDEAWLDEGINTFSEQRYFIEKYGEKGNLLTNKRMQKWLPDLNDRYLSQITSYLYSVNRMDQPVSSTAFRSADMVQYAASTYMKPSAMMWWLKEYLGDSAFNRAMQGYFRDNRFRHVDAERFYLAVEKYSQKDIRPYFASWLKTTGMSDYSVASVRQIKEQKNTYGITLSRNGDPTIPVVFSAEDEMNKRYLIPWSARGRDTVFTLQAGGKLASAMIDPDNVLLETNRWNNCRPRKYKITLGPRLPSFESYNIFWLPVPWYDNINGFRLGAMLHGAYMADGDPMVGRHQWTFSPFYGFKSKEISFSFDYQTPVGSRPRPPRAYLTAGSAFDINYAGIGLKRKWGPRLMLDPTESYDVRLDYTRYKDYRFWDPRDVDTAAVVSLIAQRGYDLTRHWGRSSFLSRITIGYLQRPESDINNYLKFELEEKFNYRISRHINPRFRLVTGYIQGPAPAQEQFFLSGSFKSTGLDNMLASGKDWFSTQERYHVDGGANLPGYYGTHLRGRNLWAVNMTLPIMKSPASFFAGAGQVANDWLEFTTKSIRADAGLSLALGPMRLMFPLWINKPEDGKKQFDWRWTIGFGGSGEGMGIKF